VNYGLGDGNWSAVMQNNGNFNILDGGDGRMGTLGQGQSWPVGDCYSAEIEDDGTFCIVSSSQGRIFATKPAPSPPAPPAPLSDPSKPWDSLYPHRNIGARLYKEDFFQIWDYMTSSDGAFRATLTSDGNLVLTKWGRQYWSTNTSGYNVYRALMQADGNFVLYTDDGSNSPWSTGTGGNSGAYLQIKRRRLPRGKALVGITGYRVTAPLHSAASRSALPLAPVPA
jgi:hypothetical protein